MFSMMTRMYCALAGMSSYSWLFRLLTICSIRYRLQTLFMLTDMKTMKQNGIIRVMIIEFWALFPTESSV